MRSAAAAWQAMVAKTRSVVRSADTVSMTAGTVFQVAMVLRTASWTGTARVGRPGSTVGSVMSRFPSGAPGLGTGRTRCGG